MAILFLAAAPGMDASRLLHASELCRHFGHHHHHDTPERHDSPHDVPGDCPHSDDIRVDSSAPGPAFTASVAEPGLPGHFVLVTARLYEHRRASLPDRTRGPPLCILTNRLQL
jgi:hypothetical protein